MKKYRKLSICISVLNAIGIVCLFYCAALYLSHDTYVVNPDTMLPMMNWERGGMMLTMGVMPMLIANTLGFLYILKKGTSIIKRLLFFIPSILEVILVLHYLHIAKLNGRICGAKRSHSVSEQPNCYQSV